VHLTKGARDRGARDKRADLASDGLNAHNPLPGAGAQPLPAGTSTPPVRWRDAAVPTAPRSPEAAVIGVRPRPITFAVGDARARQRIACLILRDASADDGMTRAGGARVRRFSVTIFTSWRARRVAIRACIVKCALPAASRCKFGVRWPQGGECPFDWSG
jgi:hypothetical protein